MLGGQKSQSLMLGGQNGAVVARPHGNVQDMGSNPAVTKNENQTLGGIPPQKVAQWSGQDLSGRPAMKSRNRPVEQNEPPPKKSILKLSSLV